MTEPATKKSKNDAEIGSDTSEEPEIIYSETTTKDVYEATGIHTLRRAREEIQDYDDPIIIVISKGKRDQLLSFLNSLDRKTTATTADINSASASTVPNIHDFDREVSSKSDGLIEAYTEIIRDLNEITQKFTEDDLSLNLPSTTNLAEFKLVRNHISKMHAHTSRTMRSIKKFKALKPLNLLRATHEYGQFIPQSIRTSAESHLRRTVHDINVKILNEDLKFGEENISKCREFISTCEAKILAKAWRSAQKNKDVAPEWRQMIWTNRPRHEAPYRPRSYRQRQYDNRREPFDNRKQYDDNRRTRDNDNRRPPEKDNRHEQLDDRRQYKDYRRLPRTSHRDNADRDYRPTRRPSRQNPNQQNNYRDYRQYKYRPHSRFEEPPRRSYRYDPRDYPSINDSTYDDHDDVFYDNEYDNYRRKN